MFMQPTIKSIFGGPSGLACSYYATVKVRILHHRVSVMYVFLALLGDYVPTTATRTASDGFASVARPTSASIKPQRRVGSMILPIGCPAEPHRSNCQQLS